MESVRLFVTLFETLNLSQTAERCMTSVASASRVLSKLRLIFGDELFTRYHLGMLPTARAREIEPVLRTMLLDQSSLFDHISRRSRDEGRREAVRRYSVDGQLEEGFFDDIRKQFGAKRIDDFILSRMDGDELEGADIALASIDDFMLFILATVRSSEDDCPFSCAFAPGEDRRGRMVLPQCTFRRR